MSVLGDEAAGVVDGPRINLWMTLLEEIFGEMRHGISQHIYHQSPCLTSMRQLHQNSIQIFSQLCHGWHIKDPLSSYWSKFTRFLIKSFFGDFCLICYNISVRGCCKVDNLNNDCDGDYNDDYNAVDDDGAEDANHSLVTMEGQGKLGRAYNRGLCPDNRRPPFWAAVTFVIILTITDTRQDRHRQQKSVSSSSSSLSQSLRRGVSEFNYRVKRLSRTKPKWQRHWRLRGI